MCFYLLISRKFYYLYTKKETNTNLKERKMLKREEAKKMIFETKGKIFGVKFTKKDGSLRTMNCRRNVSKGVKGVGLAYDPNKYNLIPVYDMANDGFRMINASTIEEVTIEGTTHTVK